MRSNRQRLMCVALIAISVASGAVADEVTDWNTIALNAIRSAPLNPPRASRALAMVHTAMFDAVNATNPLFFSYHANVVPPPNTSPRAAAAQAAHDVLVSLLPAQQTTFDNALTASLNAIPAGQSRNDGVALGQFCATDMLNLRANDNSNTVIPYTPQPPGTPGRWQPTPPGNLPALLPNWAIVTPFGMNSPTQFRPAGPPTLTSAQYTAAYNEVKQLGAAVGSTRTQDQSDIAQFWADGANTSTPPGHWNRIGQTVAAAEGNTLEENARMFALINLAMADAGISCWDAKYNEDFWRPVTGIRQADIDGNPLTDPDAAWTSFITTPNFPSYTSGHSTFSAAAARILAELFGDDTAFTTSAEGFPVADRSFLSFSAAAQEAMNSRLYGGIHWRFDNEDGFTAGDLLGDFIFDNYLRPIPEPATISLLGIVLLAVARRRRSA